MPEMRPRSNYGRIQRPHDIGRARLACRRVEAADLKFRHADETNKSGVQLKQFELYDASIRSHPGKTLVRKPWIRGFHWSRPCSWPPLSWLRDIDAALAKLPGNDLPGRALNQRRSPDTDYPTAPALPALGPLFCVNWRSAGQSAVAELSRLDDIRGLRYLITALPSAFAGD